MTKMNYVYYRTEFDIIIRMSRGPYTDLASMTTDVLRDGEWVPIDPAKFGGDLNPWASKVGNGDAVQIDDPLAGPSCVALPP